MEKSNVLKACDELYRQIQRVLMRDDLPKGFASHLACKYVCFKCDVLNFDMRQKLFHIGLRPISLDDLKKQYAKIRDLLKTLTEMKGEKSHAGN